MMKGCENKVGKSDNVDCNSLNSESSKEISGELSAVLIRSVGVDWENDFFCFEGRNYQLKEFRCMPPELEGIGCVSRFIEEKALGYKDVPEEFLPYALLHEVFCGFNCSKTPNRVGAVEKELNYVPEEIKNEYIEWRIKFFDGMCVFADKIGDEDLWEEMKVPLEYLKELYNK